ncbi:MAG: hypothetical protein ACFCUQ_09690 [Kiloniellales bacterium]
MRKPSHHLSALALAAGVTLALATPAQSQSADEPVTVHRGAEVSSVSHGVESPVSQGSPGAVQVKVVRGHGPTPGAAPVSGQEAVRRIPLQAGAGDVVWLLDADDGRLIACELVHTADLGVRNIRCRSRDLPD